MSVCKGAQAAAAARTRRLIPRGPFVLEGSTVIIRPRDPHVPLPFFAFAWSIGVPYAVHVATPIRRNGAAAVDVVLV
jgi:hypothetical protein